MLFPQSMICTDMHFQAFYSLQLNLLRTVTYDSRFQDFTGATEVSCHILIIVQRVLSCNTAKTFP